MANKVNKAQAKTKKTVVKKTGIGTAAGKARMAVKSSAVKGSAVKSATVNKKVTKTAKPAAKKATALKKIPLKKAEVAKKTSVAKKTVSKKVTPVKKSASVPKMTAVKASKTKTSVAPKKNVTIGKKVSVLAKTKPIKTTAKKTELEIKPAVKAMTTIKSSPEKAKPAKPEESIVKGVKKRIMQPLEVKIIKPSSAGLFGVMPYEEKPDEEFMNDAQKNHFREILWRWKKELMEEVDRTKNHMQDTVSRHPDPSDNATQEEEFNLELRTRDRERKLIKKIDEALERIDHDEYGYCDACGVEIGIRRLEARPTAEMCIDCKTLDEIKEKQTRG